jgi:hypothetical protein
MIGRMSVPVVLLALAVTPLLSTFAAAQGVLDVPEAGLKLKMPPIEKVALTPSDNPRHLRELRGRFGPKRVELSIWLMPNEHGGYSEPAELVDAREKQLFEKGSHGAAGFSERRELAGSYGALTYAEFASGQFGGDGGAAAGTTFAMLAFLTESAACSIEFSVDPPASDAELQSIRDSLTQGVTVAGKPRDPHWSDDEAKQRWESDVSAKVKKDPLKPVNRTAHYIILTNSAGGALFAKKMEENYAKIQATFPFPERKGRRLMPVFLFRSKEQYDDFCATMKAGVGGASKGHAWKDYYATWYESPNDPVHIHEATHQIFRNRLGLSGGGSWFQEGLAEYMCTRRDDRNVLAQNVAKGKATHLKEFVQIPQLIAGASAEQNYLEAALLIEFLRESKETKEKFAAFVEKVGQAQRGSLAQIETALHDSLGVSLDQLDQDFTKYCVKR